MHFHGVTCDDKTKVGSKFNLTGGTHSECRKRIEMNGMERSTHEKQKNKNQNAKKLNAIMEWVVKRVVIQHICINVIWAHQIQLYINIPMAATDIIPLELNVRRRSVCTMFCCCCDNKMLVSTNFFFSFIFIFVFERGKSMKCFEFGHRFHWPLKSAKHIFRFTWQFVEIVWLESGLSIEIWVTWHLKWMPIIYNFIVNIWIFIFFVCGQQFPLMNRRTIYVNMFSLSLSHTHLSPSLSFSMSHLLGVDVELETRFNSQSKHLNRTHKLQCQNWIMHVMLTWSCQKLTILSTFIVRLRWTHVNIFKQ